VVRIPLGSSCSIRIVHASRTVSSGIAGWRVRVLFAHGAKARGGGLSFERFRYGPKAPTGIT